MLLDVNNIKINTSYFRNLITNTLVYQHHYCHYQISRLSFDDFNILQKAVTLNVPCSFCDISENMDHAIVYNPRHMCAIITLYYAKLHLLYAVVSKKKKKKTIYYKGPG